MDKREIDIANSLLNPDRPKEKTFTWDIDFQRQVLAMLLSDEVSLTQSINMIDWKYFESYEHRLICRIVLEHFSQYKTLPNKLIIQNEIKERKADDDYITRYIGELDAIYASYHPGILQRDYCLDKIEEFAKRAAMGKAMADIFKLIQSQKSWEDDAADIFKKAQLVGRTYDDGLDYFADPAGRYEMMKSQEMSKQIFTSGFEEIDQYMSFGGLSRKEIGAFLGTSGVGKSWLLCNAAVKNILLGWKVLYVSLEMEPIKLAKRFDSLIAGIPAFDLLKESDAVVEAVKEQVEGKEDKRLLIIKEFAAGTANVDTIRGHLSHLALNNFKPDLLIVDYLGLMKGYDGLAAYESLEKLVTGLRGLAMELNLAVLTAVQANREGQKASSAGGRIDGSHIGDSYGIKRPLDALWAINKPEHCPEIGYIHIDKHRDGFSGMNIYFQQDPKTMQVSSISKATYDELSVQKKSSIIPQKFTGTRNTEDEVG